MRTRRTISATFAALAIAIVAAGCNSTSQPTSAPVQTASLEFGTTAQVDLYNCWEIWADANGDGVIEDQFQLSCDQIFENGVAKQVQVPAPWHYSLAITVIRAGQTQEQIIAASIIPGDSIDDFVSLTPYDPASDTGATKDSDGVNFYITPGGTPPSGASKVVSNASRLWLEGNGFALGEPNVLEHVPPKFDVDLNQGDTIIVRARKQKLSDAPAWLPDDTPKQLELVGTLSIQGVHVPLQGTSASPGADMAGVTFSYTKR